MCLCDELMAVSLRETWQNKIAAKKESIASASQESTIPRKNGASEIGRRGSNRFFLCKIVRCAHTLI